jgi:hypothetical protein
MVDRDHYNADNVVPPRDTDEACQRIAESMGGVLLTRPADIEPGLSHSDLAQVPRRSHGVNVTAFYDNCRLNADGTEKQMPGRYRGPEYNPMEDLLAFEDLTSALGATHLARLSSALDAANMAGLDVPGFDFTAADPLNSKFVLKQVAEELGLKPIDAEHPLPLRQAWKVLATDTVKRARKRASEHVRARAAQILESKAAAKLLKRADEKPAPR